MRPSLSQKWQRSPPRWAIDGVMLGIPRTSSGSRQSLVTYVVPTEARLQGKRISIREPTKHGVDIGVVLAATS